MTGSSRFARVFTYASRPSIAIGGGAVIAVACLGVAWYVTRVPFVSTYTPVTVGPITEEVDVSSTVKAAQDTDLSFQTVGQVAMISVAVGDHVNAGKTLVTLQNGSQSAALALAQANLQTQEAKLAALNAGTRPEQLAIDETALAQASTTLANAAQGAYIGADDAIHAKADQLFTNPRLSMAALTPLVPDATLVNRVQAERVALEPLLAALSVPRSSGDPVSSAEQIRADLNTVSTFLDDLSRALAEAMPNAAVSATALTAYQSSVNAARLEVSAGLAALTAAETVYQSASGALTLARAGATGNDLDAQQAAVSAARASVSAAQIALAQTYLTAPISGTVSAQNANLGETIAPGEPLVSLISDGTREADARVSEIDVAKIKVGNPVMATIDAYPGASFGATVTAVAPAAVLTNGVPAYTVTITFDANDSRVKPGLSANLRIITATAADALLVPTSAIITNGDAQFVYLRRGGQPVEVPVMTGISSAIGMTEITSGLSEGETVLTFGAYATRS